MVFLESVATFEYLQINVSNNRQLNCVFILWSIIRKDFFFLMYLTNSILIYYQDFFTAALIFLRNMYKKTWDEKKFGNSSFKSINCASGLHLYP